VRGGKNIDGTNTKEEEGKNRKNFSSEKREREGRNCKTKQKVPGRNNSPVALKTVGDRSATKRGA